MFDVLSAEGVEERAGIVRVALLVVSRKQPFEHPAMNGHIAFS
jgi:hypothetical protein